jgi:RNA exonuclease 1
MIYILSGADLYKRLQQFVLTEDQLKENNFPRPDPVQGGTAIFYGEQKKSQKGSTKGIMQCSYIFFFY